MKVIRCKDCALANELTCPMNYIDHQRMIITERSPMFFCGKAQPSAGYEPTNGDNIRNMSDAQLADLLYSKEKEGYDMHGHEGKAFSWALLKKIYRAYVSTPESEDIVVKEDPNEQPTHNKAQS